MLVPRQLTVLVGAALFGGWPGPGVQAACVASGSSTTCNTNAPNPATAPIGQGPSTTSGASVTLQPNARLEVGNASAVSLGNNAAITLGAGAVISNVATSGAGLWTAGNNTVEFGSNGTLNIAQGAKIQSLGTQTNAEAINVMGSGNTIINRGLISGGNAAAIWFEDRTVGAANIVDNYGTIQAGNGTSSNVIGNSGSGNVNFINRSGAVVNGSLTFASGNDSLTLYPGSIITGGFNGGGGTNSLLLAGDAGSSDTLPGAIRNFQSLTKTGDGKWTLSGTVGGNGGGTPLAVAVQGGTLALTGDNTSFNGSVVVDAAGTLEARAQSLPPSVTNNGQVLFNQPDNGTYAGTISGTGAVSKIQVGILTLTGVNTYQGGTRIQGGAVAVGADSALGASSGGVTLDGGALAFTNSFSLSGSRNVTVTANNGTLSANPGVTGTVTQAITGPGALTKDGAGTVVLTSNANNWAGATTIAAGTLQLGNGGASGNLPGATGITNNGTLAFNRSDMFTFGNLISGTGGIRQMGSGTTILTGNNGYAGPTSVTAGALYVNGTQTGTGAATVGNGATLGGTGTLGGSVTVQSGGTLAPGGVGAVPGTLSIGGDLTLQSGSALAYSFGQAGVVGGPLNDLTNVGGNLALGGTLNVQTSAGGSFDPGVYRVINYGGALSGTLALGTVPTPGNYFIQTSVDKQVNLVNTNGLTLNYWDGASALNKNNNTVDGGPGIWMANGPGTNDNWTGMTGSLNAPWSQSSFAVFMGQGDTVRVDSTTNGAILAQGMQFAADGYTLVGNTATDVLTLVGAAAAGGGPNEAVIRVGNGVAEGAGYTATLSATVAGAAKLVKTDLGTLVLSGINTYTGGTAINGGVLQVAQDANLGNAAGALSLNGGTLRATGTFATARATTLGAGGGSFDVTGANVLTMNSAINGSGALSKLGTGTLALAADNVYAGGTTITAGTLQLGTGAGGSATGSILGNVANSGTLAFNRSNAYAFGGTISGTGGVMQMGAGTTTLTANNTYTGGTTISAGTLQLGNGGTTGAILGNVVNNGGLVFNRGNGYAFGGVISGTGTVNQQGAGTTVLSANNAYAGATTVNAGGLFVNGDQTAATGATTVNNSATLGGKGVIGGDVTLTGNSVLSPGDNSATPGTLTIQGSLTLGSGTSLNYGFGQANVAGGPFNDLTNVGGNLSLGGKLNVSLSPGGSFDPGIYRVINYGGTLSNPGSLTLGTLPAGADPANYFVQTSVDKQVNLVNTNGLTLNYWDGDAGPKNNGQVNGGTGTWVAPGGVNDNWTDANGTLNAPWSQGAFAVFTGQSGSVTVDSSANGAIRVQGMQFATDGYLLLGATATDKLTLTGTPAAGGGPNEAVIRVGAGSADGANYTAIIVAVLDGAAKLVKTDLGTLLLLGANTYQGGTAINGGVLQVMQDANLGDAAGALSLDSGTLRADGTFATARATTLGAGGGSVDVTGANVLTMNSAINGSGALNKLGTGTLELAGDNVYTGGTTITAGTLQLGTGAGGSATGSLLGNVANSGTLAFNRSNSYTYAGMVSGTGNVVQMGSGTTVLTGTNTYAGGTTISAGTLQLGAGGTTGSITGNVTNNGALVFNRSDTSTFGGLISGGGTVSQNGSGTTVLTANNTYTGGTTITAGTLQLGAGGATGSIVGDVVNAGTLAFNRSDTYTFGGVISGGGKANQLGSGTTVLTANNTYTGGTTITAGTLQLGAGGATGSIAGDVSNNGALAFNRSDIYAFGGLISGGGKVNQIGSGTTILTANNTYTGGTTISSGILQLGNGGTSGSLQGDVVNNSLLWVSRSDQLQLNGVMSGTGAFVQQGSGVTVLTGKNSYTGMTIVDTGSLFVNGDQSAANGDTSVFAGGTLGGTGIIGGNVIVGGTLSPGDTTGAPGTLTVNGNLTLNNPATLTYSFGQAGAVGGPLNDLTIVKGDLVLDGTLNVTTPAGGSFDPGVYRIISYDGALTDNGLAIGTIPSPSFSVQTAVDKQVNLVNTAGLTLNFWDGATVPGKNNGTVDGGNGVWQNSAGNNNWTNTLGVPNAPYADATFSIFMAAPGAVTVDNSLGQVRSGGMQFASNGYQLTGGAIELAPDAGGGTTIRVGDGSSLGAGYVTTFNTALTGASRLVKTDLGTLVLNTANTYTGGTEINGGTLQISNDAALGRASTALGMNGGTLRTTQTLTQSRPITLGASGGGVEPVTGTTLIVTSDIGGAGSLTKLGGGTAILTGNNSYGNGTLVKDGVTVIKAGTLQVGNGGTSGNIMGIVSNDGILAFNRSDRYVQTDVINGSGQVIQQGGGTTVFNAVNGYTGGTTVAAGALAVGDANHAGAAINSGGPVTVQGGATFGGYGSVKGNVTNAGTLAVADAFPGLGGGAGGFGITGNLINSGTVNLAGAAPGNRLTVTGNYQGVSGVVALNTVLGADNSPSDKLVISGGTASGNTTLRITNQGGLGAKTTGDGIQVVQALNGATTAPGAFASGGLYAGAYAYQLFRGGVTPGTTQNWYLRSELINPNPDPRTRGGIDPPGVPTYRPGVPIYTEIPSLARELAVQQIGTFHERQGNQDLLTGTGSLPSGWARTWGDHFSERRDGTVRQSFSGNIFGMQAGQDLYARSTDSGHQDRYGVFLGYARADGNVKGFAMGQDNFAAGKLSIDSYSVGGYWTHIGPSGWYTDTVIMGSHLKAKPRSMAGDSSSTDGKAFTASVEAGLPIPLKSNLTLEPQAQIIYQNTRIDAVRDSASDVSFAPKNAVIGRVGARLQGEFQAGGTTWKPYLRADLLHTLGGNDSVRFNDTTSMTSAMGGTQALLGLGVSVKASDRVSVYASTGYGVNLGGDRREMVQGNVGVQIRW
ncbi:autotransporter-associated beta strand repeat-containing protein [Achromobacter sp. UMC71]|uniref:autotransporter-associated beta strand repeat-containing protein n=1 Tax=Achromobacter sp. UMC71 TaxID=1862320 RepID=UPI001602B596|nr:autotransporter-associated beta strand repeat-containing protein [Achromobacter sp. UMC71]